MQKTVAVLFLVLLIAPGVFGQTRPDALIEFRQGNFERAVQICLDELQENPNNLESHVVICWSLISLGRLDEALSFAQSARRISRYDVRVIQILGEVHFRQGRNNQALQYFRLYTSLAPEGARIAQVYFFKGEIYIRTGRFRHADIALSTAVHWTPGNAVWWTRLAFARENAGNINGAIAAYERALSLNPQLTDARIGLERVRQALAG